MSQGISTIRTPASRPTSDLSRETLLRMANAGVKAVASIADLHARGSNLVIEVLRGSGDFIQWEHYPPDDVRSPISRAILLPCPSAGRTGSAGLRAFPSVRGTARSASQ